MGTNVAQNETILRGGFPALGPKVGLISQVVDLSSTANGDAEKVWTFEGPTVVLASGFEITGALGTSVTVALGVAEDGATLMGAGTATGCGQVYPQYIAANGCVYASVGGGTPAATAEVRVWAIIADVDDPVS
jgi:hypothetical protein